MNHFKKQIVDLIGVQIDLGASKRGVNMGPSAMRYSSIVKKIHDHGLQCNDLGDITPDSFLNNLAENTKLKNLQTINTVNYKLYETIREILHHEHFPFILGGDHSLSVGTILGVQSVFENIGVIWIDAHGDYNNEETSPSGNLHGMSLSACTGNGPNTLVPFKPDHISFINPNNVVLVAARDLDAHEKISLEKNGIHVFTMASIDKLGMKEVMKKTLSLVNNGTRGFHVSFDLDAISPNEAPGVGTPVYGGLTFREAHLAAEMIAENNHLLSAEIVELNPILDDKNKTAELAVHLALSLLGQTIY